MSGEIFHRVLPLDGPRPWTRTLLTKGGGHIDDESAFLVQLGAILPGMTVVRVNHLMARTIATMERSANAWIIPDRHEIASLRIAPETVTISGHYVDKLRVTAPRFIELLEGWRALLAEDLAVDVDHTPLFLEDDGSEDGEDDHFDALEYATAVLEATGHAELRYRLSHGRLTASHDEAVGDLPVRRRRCAASTARAHHALDAVAPAFGRPTPARTRAIEGLLREQLLPRSIARTFLQTAHVGDAAWELLRPLEALASPTEVVVRRWNITLDIGGRRHAVPPPHQPLDKEESPVAELRALTELLRADGWTPKDVSTLQVPEHDLVVPRRRLVLVRPYERRPMPWTAP